MVSLLLKSVESAKKIQSSRTGYDFTEQFIYEQRFMMTDRVSTEMYFSFKTLRTKTGPKQDQLWEQNQVLP